MTMQTSSIEAIRKRAPHAKTRTGCRTCKSRRIKCDETKPFCKRCTTTGRTCDGYESTFKIREERGINKAQSATIEARHKQAMIMAGLIPASASTSTPASSPASTWSGREQRAFEFFRTQVAAGAETFFTSGFWNRSVLQICQSEPAIRHAAIAIASLQELSSSKREESDGTLAIANDTYALEHYNKALVLLQQRIANAPKDASSRNVVLAACILFTVLELMQENLQSAARHLKAGLSIVAELDQDADSPESDLAPSVVSTHIDYVEDEITEVLARLDMSSVFFKTQEPCFKVFAERAAKKQRLLDFDLVHPRIPTTFRSVGEAKQYNDLLTDLVSNFIHSRRRHPSFGIGEGAQQDEDLLEHWHEMKEQMTIYDAAYTTLLTDLKSRPTTTQQELDALDLLRLHRNCVYTMLHVSLNNGRELAYDEYNHLFDETTTAAERFAARPAALKSLCTFMLGVGIIAPLYYVAIKCRQPAVRRRAIRALTRLQHREGAWVPQRLARWAAATVLYEETHDPDARAAPLLPEKARLHGATCDWTDSAAGANVLYCKRRQFETDGAWLEWRAEVNMDALPVVLGEHVEMADD